jgi:hypothetical protein
MLGPGVYEHPDTVAATRRLNLAHSFPPALMHRFPRGELGGRLSSVFKVPKNCPHWNPGPGTYAPAVRYTGASMEMGADAPRAVFGKGDKLITPSQNLAATVFVSEVRWPKKEPESYPPESPPKAKRIAGDRG